MPPMIDSSTDALILISLPTRSLIAFAILSDCALVRLFALTTSAVISPLCSAIKAFSWRRNESITNRRLFDAMRAKVLVRFTNNFILFPIATMAPFCSSLVYMGELIRSLSSLLSFSALAKLSTSVSNFATSLLSRTKSKIAFA